MSGVRHVVERREQLRRRRVGSWWKTAAISVVTQELTGAGASGRQELV